MTDLLRKIEWIDIDTLVPYERNPKIHTQEQIKRLMHTFERYGFDVPIVLDEDRVIIKGHARYDAAKQLKWKKVPVIFRNDLSPQEVSASRIADNKVAEAYWDIPSLIQELEALFNLDDDTVPITDTGFDEMEIKSLLPGMLETEEDYRLPPGEEGGVPTFRQRLRQDGKIGRPDKHKESLSSEEIFAQFKNVIVPFFGGKNNLAALLEAVRYAKDKVTVMYATPGTKPFPWTLPYVKHITDTLDVPLVDVSPKDSKYFRGRVTAQGYPSKDVLWCESGIVFPGIENYIKKNELLNSSTVMVLGVLHAEETTYRKIASFEKSYYYYCPFLDRTEEDLYVYFEESMPDAIGLHPLYKHVAYIGCPGCPLYDAPDFSFFKNDPRTFPLWIQWLEYFSYSKRNISYRNGGRFDAFLREYIAEAIDPRVVLPFSKFAMAFEDFE
jgi:3'-phosphoadenosine 5'-phosphosulfate sulfotransferase (PAPS reductase)/FAD synthetase